jgi:hypothetical protein
MNKAFRSQMGHEQPKTLVRRASDLPQTADIGRREWQVSSTIRAQLRTQARNKLRETCRKWRASRRFMERKNSVPSGRESWVASTILVSHLRWNSVWPSGFGVVRSASSAPCAHS